MAGTNEYGEVPIHMGGDNLIALVTRADYEELRAAIRSGHQRTFDLKVRDFRRPDEVNRTYLVVLTNVTRLGEFKPIMT